MAKKTTTQICPICGAKHDEPVGVTRPTCGKPDCIRALRKQKVPGTLTAPTPTMAAAAEPKKPKKPKKAKRPKKAKHD